MFKRAALYLRVSTESRPRTTSAANWKRWPGGPGGRLSRSTRTPASPALGGRDKRPAFDKLNKDASRRKFDVVMAWSVDRLGRSLQDLGLFLNELRDPDLFLQTSATKSSAIRLSLCGRG